MAVVAGGFAAAIGFLNAQITSLQSQVTTLTSQVTSLQTQVTTLTADLPNANDEAAATAVLAANGLGPDLKPLPTT